MSQEEATQATIKDLLHMYAQKQVNTNNIKRTIENEILKRCASADTSSLKFSITEPDKKPDITLKMLCKEVTQFDIDFFRSITDTYTIQLSSYENRIEVLLFIDMEE